MHRKVEAGRGAGWIVDGLGRLNRHGGVFAGIGLLLGAMSALPGFAQLLGPLAGALKNRSCLRHGIPPPASGIQDPTNWPQRLASARFR